MIKVILYSIWYNLFVSILVNAFVFPIAWSFLKSARKNKGFLWGFLHDGNDFGDSTFHPNLKYGFTRAWLWAMRNPLHNFYYRNYKAAIETNHVGTATVKFDANISAWRTFTCSDTGDNNGKVIDFTHSLFGTQEVTFERDGKEEYRKSYCKPFVFLFWIVIFKWRHGYENGLKQSQFNFGFFNLKDNEDNYLDWKQIKWVTI